MFTDFSNAGVFYTADSCSNETKWDTLGSDLLKQSGMQCQCFSFGAQNSCDRAMAFFFFFYPTSALVS